jgi:hypothetical protein
VCRAGWARRENQTSSAKPKAQPGRSRARAISRSRRRFLRVGGVGAGQPALGPLPAHAEPQQRLPDRLDRQHGLAQPLRVRHSRQEAEGPRAAGVAERARRLVQDRAQPPQLRLAQDRRGAPRPRRAGLQRRYTAGVEGADAVAHRLHGAAQTLGDLPRAAPVGAQEHDLRAPDGEGVGGAQGRFEPGAFLSARLADEDGRVHPGQVRPAPRSHKTSPEAALGPRSRSTALGCLPELMDGKERGGHTGAYLGAAAKSGAPGRGRG